MFDACANLIGKLVQVEGQIVAPVLAARWAIDDTIDALTYATVGTRWYTADEWERYYPQDDPVQTIADRFDVPRSMLEGKAPADVASIIHAEFERRMVYGEGRGVPVGIINTVADDEGSYEVTGRIPAGPLADALRRDATQGLSIGPHGDVQAVSLHDSSIGRNRYPEPFGTLLTWGLNGTENRNETMRRLRLSKDAGTIRRNVPSGAEPVSRALRQLRALATDTTG